MANPHTYQLLTFCPETPLCYRYPVLAQLNSPPQPLSHTNFFFFFFFFSLSSLSLFTSSYSFSFFFSSSSHLVSQQVIAILIVSCSNRLRHLPPFSHSRHSLLPTYGPLDSKPQVSLYPLRPLVRRLFETERQRASALTASHIVSSCPLMAVVLARILRQT